MKMFKCFKITPCSNTSFDSIIVQADKTWKNALEEVEGSLETQFLESDKDWEDIKVTIECCYRTKEELDELEDYYLNN